MAGWYVLIAGVVSGAGAIAFLKFVADALVRGAQGLKLMDMAERRAQVRRNALEGEPVTAERAA